MKSWQVLLVLLVVWIGGPSGMVPPTQAQQEDALETTDFFGGDFSVYDEQIEDDFVWRGRRSRSHRSATHPGGWVGGAELVAFRPEATVIQLNTVLEDSLVPESLLLDDSLADLDQFEPGVRLWLGWQNRTGGLLGRYFRFSEVDRHEALQADPPTFRGSADERLSVSAWDIEWHRRWSSDSRRWDLGFGLRYAEFQHDERLDLVAAFDDGLAVGSAHAARRARGLGPVISLEGTYGLGETNRWALFWSTRSAALFGQQQLNANVFSLADRNSTLIDVSQREFRDDDWLWIGEAQLGVWWFHPFSTGQQARLRVAAEYQYWRALTEALPTSAAASDGGINTSSQVEAGPVRLSLVGLSIGFEVGY